ncbi:MAG: hypothetical protein Q8R08_04720 [bacterium]|nr:hypothetical protein [bacterium]
MSNTNRLFRSMFFLGLVAVLAVTPAFAQATTFTQNVTFPIAIAAWVPCAAGGAGEFVVLTGQLHSLFHVTITPGFGFKVESHANPQGVSGVGQSTGAKYQGTGVTRSGFGASGLPFHATYINNFRLIGQGKAPNLTIHENFHVTVNANGQITAYIDNFTFECK